MRHLTRLLSVSLLLASICAAQCAREVRYVKVTILHTNDTHAHLLPFSRPAPAGDAADPSTFRNIGGIARRATLIRQARAASANVLVLDAGDVLDGSPFSVEFKGEADIAAMNTCGYDAMVTGNHEYSNTMSDFLKRKSEARFPILGANVSLSSNGSPLLTACKMLSVGGLKVAVLGITVPLYYSTNMSSEIKTADPVETASHWVPRLREQADAVVLLNHIGFDEDRALAAQVEGIDAIIGGHSHTRVDKPVLVKRAGSGDPFWVGGTVVAQDGEWGATLGRVDLIFRRGKTGWTLMSSRGELIPVTAGVPEDPLVRKVVEKFHRRIARYDRIVCQAGGDFTGEASYNLLADALRGVSRAEISLNNYGSVRTDLMQGPVTLGAVADWFPFANTILTFKATGAQIRKMLLDQRPSVSGIRYRIENGGLVAAEIGGMPIDDTRVYSGVTTSFLAKGMVTPDMSPMDAGASVRDEVVRYLQSVKTVTPDDERRGEF